MNIYKYLYFVVVGFYCLFLSQYGMENWDTGYIPSFSWRVLNGQDIYQDFIYKGPPITIYFHAFWMKIIPVVGQFYYIRLVNYLLFASQVYLTVSGFNAIYNFESLKINKWILSTICFIISIHNFTPSPWPTTDGLLFASVAFFIVSKSKKYSLSTLFLVSVFCLLSALTKQSFYLIPFGFLVWIYSKAGVKKSCFYTLFLLLNFSVFLIWISTFTSLSNYFEQTSNQTRFIDIYNYTILNYIHCFHNKWLLLIAVLLPLALTKLFDEFFTIKSYLKYVTIVFFITAILFHVIGYFFNNADLYSYSKNLLNSSLVLFNTCLLAVLYYYCKKPNLEFLIPITVSLLIAWSASISAGYPYPILYSTGMISCLSVHFYSEIPQFKRSKLIYISIVFCVLAVSFYSNKKPYNDSTLLNLKYNLSTVSPKLKYIKTDYETYSKLTEIKKLIKKYGTRFIVAPHTPMANYIFNTKSQLPADWIINNEVMGRDQKFIKQASDKNIFIFIEKEYVKHPKYSKEHLLYSQATYYIYENFNRIDETKNFIVFNAPK